MIISILTPILGFLATSITASPLLSARQSSDGLIHSVLWLPEYTRIGNQWGEPGGSWGPWCAEDRFARSQLDNSYNGEGTTKTDADGWNRREVFWYIYKNTGTMQSKPLEEGGQPINPLGDEYILWNMTCYDAIHVSSNDTAFYTQKLDVSASSIVRPYGSYDWESLKGKANFYCPQGQCIHENVPGKRHRRGINRSTINNTITRLLLENPSSNRLPPQQQFS